MRLPDIAAACGTVLLSACSGPSATQFNTDSVTIRTTSLGPRVAAIRLARTEAEDICATRDRVPEYQSTTADEEAGTEEHFFLCV